MVHEDSENPESAVSRPSPVPSAKQRRLTAFRWFRNFEEQVEVCTGLKSWSFFQGCCKCDGISGSGVAVTAHASPIYTCLSAPAFPFPSSLYRNAIMTLFYNGSLQEGIAAAVRDAKAVACFVRGR